VDGLLHEVSSGGPYRDDDSFDSIVLQQIPILDRRHCLRRSQAPASGPAARSRNVNPEMVEI